MIDTEVRKQAAVLAKMLLGMPRAPRAYLQAAGKLCTLLEAFDATAACPFCQGTAELAQLPNAVTGEPRYFVRCVTCGYQSAWSNLSSKAVEIHNAYATTSAKEES